MRQTRHGLLALVVLLTGIITLVAPETATAGSLALQPGEASTFTSLGYGDATARTMYGSLNYFFPIAAGQVPTPGSSISLSYSHSPLLVPDRSTMTVVVNGTSAASVFLTEESADRSTLDIDIPESAFSGEGLFVQVQFQMRLTRDECEESENPALWATVHGDSTLDLQTDATDAPPDLADLSRLFLSTETEPHPVTVVIEDDAPAEVLEAAGIAAFALGRWAGEAGQSVELRLASTANDDEPSVVISVGFDDGADWGAVEWAAQHVLVAGAQIPDEHGVIALARIPIPRLLLSGATPAAVLNAARAIADPERRVLLAGGHAIVSGSDVVSRASAGWTEGAASFAQLGIQTRRVEGPGMHAIDLFMVRPPSWQIEDGASLELAIRTSTAIRPETSWVSASVNGQTLATRAIDLEGNGRYAFDLLPGALTVDAGGESPRASVLQVRVFLDTADAGCQTIAPEGVWADLQPTSAWLLPHDESTNLDLTHYPAPFAAANGQRGSAVVIGDERTSDDFSAGLAVAASLGRWTPWMNTPLPRLVEAGALADVDRESLHVIALGGPERNTMTRMARDENGALFDSDTSNPAIYQVPSSGQGARLVLGQSPWADDAAMLVIDGSEPIDVLVTARALNEENIIRALRGDVVAIVDGLAPQTLQTDDGDSDGDRSVDTTPRVVTDDESLVERLQAWQVVGAVLLGAFIAILLLIAGLRWRRHGGTAR